jgi:hypothetical protein
MGNPLIRIPRELHNRARGIALQRRIPVWDAVLIALDNDAKKAAALESHPSSIQQKPKSALSAKTSRALHSLPDGQ